MWSSQISSCHGTKSSPKARAAGSVVTAASARPDPMAEATSRWAVQAVS